ncbi:hypothetical protein D3C81_1604450 [compost metagenome]
MSDRAGNRLLEYPNARSRRCAGFFRDQVGNDRGDLVGLDTALTFLVVGVEVVLPVVADLALAIEQQHRQQTSPVCVGTVGQLA